MSQPHHHTRATSIAAAVSMHDMVPSNRARILHFILERGSRGATREEISIALDVKIQTVTPTVHDLLSKRMIAPSVTEPTRKTTTGREAEVIVGIAFTRPMQSALFGMPNPTPKAYH